MKVTKNIRSKVKLLIECVKDLVTNINISVLILLFNAVSVKRFNFFAKLCKSKVYTEGEHKLSINNIL